VIPRHLLENWGVLEGRQTQPNAMDNDDDILGGYDSCSSHWSDDEPLLIVNESVVASSPRKSQPSSTPKWLHSDQLFVDRYLLRKV
jgi:hypothetical protein